jgi:hypothetical protein
MVGITGTELNDMVIDILYQDLKCIGLSKQVYSTDCGKVGRYRDMQKWCIKSVSTGCYLVE